MKIAFRIPYKPLTVNKSWRGGARYKTKEYIELKEFINQYILIDDKLRGLNIGIEIQVTYNFYIKNYSRTDVANLEKSLSDSLVSARVYRDDRIIKRMILEKFKTPDQEYIDVIIEPYSSISN